MQKKNGAIVLESKQVYSNRGLAVVEENFSHPSEAAVKNYRYIVMKPSIRVVPITKHDEVIFIEEYKYPIDEYILALPAGTVEDTENFLEGAKRELEEETGYTSSKLHDLGGYYPMAGTLQQEARAILALDAVKCDVGNPDAYEKSAIRAKKLINLSDLYDVIHRGQLKDGQAMTAILMAMSFMAQK